MPGKIYTRLAAIAADNYGYVTTTDAEEAGIDPHRLVELAHRGQLERRATALYRVPLIPSTPLDPYREATLWPRRAEGVISHATALDLYGISDVDPAKIHITLPSGHRPRRELPRQYAAHYEDLGTDEVTTHEGIPIVTAAKAIRQSRLLGPAILRQAIEEGAQRGLLSLADAKEIAAELGQST